MHEVVGGDWRDVITSLGMPRTAGSLRKLGEQPGTASVSELPEGTVPADTLTSDFWSWEPGFLPASGPCFRVQLLRYLWGSLCMCPTTGEQAFPTHPWTPRSFSVERGVKIAS